MSGSLVADLGVGPEIWLFMTFLSCMTLFFKFSRFWSVRNLDLCLIFAMAPGMQLLVGHRSASSLWAFVLLFLGSMLWLVRCFVDLGLSRRPLLEPNLNAPGLACLVIGVVGLFIAETVSLPVGEGAKRNPADSSAGQRADPPHFDSTVVDETVETMIQIAPLPRSLVEKPRPVVLQRVLACLAHLALVAGMILVGVRHFDRPIAGLAAAVCYLLLPYSRFALVDTGQVVPAALIVMALVFYQRPALVGALIGLAAGWMPACLGLIPLWAGFYRKRGLLRFTSVGLGVVLLCGFLGMEWTSLATWARALGARSLAEAGLVPNVVAPVTGSFWSGFEPSFRLPVLIAYLFLVIGTAYWPAEKNLGELISLSAAVLIASQFWYLDAGGTLIILYLPLLVLMMFRPNLAARRPALRHRRSLRTVQKTLFPGD
ncbi:hypothetical protein TA3x_001182 [Tundrisphaera sp. TA3]|uniref:hypothetical protein n=1 Tax=Tundrisphaera sp. TA3 TaxID=3435775 RepID=UPI003EBFD137